MLRSLLLAAGLMVAVSAVGVLPPLPDEILSGLPAAGGEDSLGPPVAGQCSDPHLLSCQAKFNGDLGIATTADWHQPFTFHYALQSIYQKNGTQGVVAVCKAFRDFSQCLGNTYSACVNPLFFLQHGYGVQNSYTYPAILAGVHFQCGGGLETLLGSFQCIENQRSVANQTLQICIATYQHDMAVYPQQSCQNAVAYLNCVRQPFQQNCGAPASWYICEATRAGIAIHQPYCDPNVLRCYVGVNGAREAEAGVRADHPALAFPDKAHAFQAAMQEMAQGRQAKLYDAIAEELRAKPNA